MKAENASLLTGSCPLDVRPPWPDELGRLWKFLGNPRTFSGVAHPRVVAIGDPPRFIAAFALEEGEGHQGRLCLKVQPRFVRPEVVTALVNSAKAIAREVGIHVIEVVQPEDSPLVELLTDHSFHRIRTDAFWLGRIEGPVLARFRKAIDLHRSFNARRPELPYKCQPYKAEFAKAASELAAHYNLAPLRASPVMAIRQFAEESGYNESASFVVLHESKLAGALLVKTIGSLAFVHIRAVHPACQHHTHIINLFLLGHFADAMLNQPALRPVDSVAFSAQPNIEKETAALADRLRIPLHQTASRFRLSFAQDNNS